MESAERKHHHGLDVSIILCSVCPCCCWVFSFLNSNMQLWCLIFDRLPIIVGHCVFVGLRIALGSFLSSQLDQLVRCFAHRWERSHIWPVRCAKLCLRRSSTRLRAPVCGPKASNGKQHSTAELRRLWPRSKREQLVIITLKGDQWQFWEHLYSHVKGYKQWFVSWYQRLLHDVESYSFKNASATSCWLVPRRLEVDALLVTTIPKLCVFTYNYEARYAMYRWSLRLP